jgi:hypothetical protein
LVEWSFRLLKKRTFAQHVLRRCICRMYKFRTS